MLTLSLSLSQRVIGRPLDIHCQRLHLSSFSLLVSHVNLPLVRLCKRRCRSFVCGMPGTKRKCVSLLSRCSSITADTLYQVHTNLER